MDYLSMLRAPNITHSKHFPYKIDSLRSYIKKYPQIT